ncbi:hypothetical protein [Mesorhizobium sp. M0678]|uniref:hypothetical protein n=1 Tax=Mesorhizobium sp. M0678 TaxID=2956985 RepID=UPI003338E3CB
MRRYELSDFEWSVIQPYMGRQSQGIVSGRHWVISDSLFFGTNILRSADKAQEDETILHHGI